jgi:hypothetical protein
MRRLMLLAVSLALFASAFLTLGMAFPTTLGTAGTMAASASRQHTSYTTKANLQPLCTGGMVSGCGY